MTDFLPPPTVDLNLQEGTTLPSKPKSKRKPEEEESSLNSVEKEQSKPKRGRKPKSSNKSKDTNDSNIDRENEDNKGKRNESEDESDLEEEKPKESEIMEPLPKPKFTLTQAHMLSQKNDFFMLMSNSTPFKELVDLISPVVESINFKIVDRPSKNGSRFRGITVNSMDKHKASMIVARLQADELFPAENFEEQSFCVKSLKFSNLIKTVKPKTYLELSRLKTGSEIDIRGYHPNHRNYETLMTCQTLDKDEEKVPNMQILDYRFVVDLDLHVFKSITRVAKTSEIGSEHIRFQILEQIDEKKETKYTKVCISIEDDDGHATIRHIFRSITKWEKNAGHVGHTVITTSETITDTTEIDESSLEIVLDERYRTDLIHLFIKSMDKSVVTLRLSPDKPLVIMYPLGNENIGYCNFIMAPIMKEESEGDKMTPKSTKS
jgi:hypothetical protein